MAEAATMAVVQAAVAAAVAATVAVAVAMAALAAGMAAVVAAAAATTNWIGGRGFSASASWIRGVSHLLAVAVAVAMAALAAGTAAVVAVAAAATTNWIGGRNDGLRWWIFRIGIMDPWGSYPPEAAGRAPWRNMALALTQDRSNHWGLIMTMLAGWRKTWQKKTSSSTQCTFVIS